MEIEITRSEKPHSEYGLISKIKYPDDSYIYISKKGFHHVTPKSWFQSLKNIFKRGGRSEILVSYKELSAALQEYEQWHKNGGIDNDN